MQHRREGNAGIVGQRVPQRQRPVCRELRYEPFRQRLDCVVLFAFGVHLRRTGANSDDRMLSRLLRLIGGW
jgi:hypothetical protein